MLRILVVLLKLVGPLLGNVLLGLGALGEVVDAHGAASASGRDVHGGVPFLSRTDVLVTVHDYAFGVVSWSAEGIRAGPRVYRGLRARGPNVP